MTRNPSDRSTTHATALSVSQLSLRPLLRVCRMVKAQRSLLLAKGLRGSSLGKPRSFLPSCRHPCKPPWMEKLLGWLLQEKLRQPCCGLFSLHGHPSWSRAEAWPDCSAVRKRCCTGIKEQGLVIFDFPEISLVGFAVE